MAQDGRRKVPRLPSATEEEVSQMATLLDLDGAQLEKELQRIIKENPPRYKPWTPKEDAILKRLKDARVPIKTIAEKLGRTSKSVDMKSRNL